MQPNHSEQGILVVDDDRLVRMYAHGVLQQNGHPCTLANNAEEAIEELSTQSFALVITDVMMPGRSGIELIKFIKANHPDVATIMMTGLDEQRIACAAIALGVYSYLVKPFEPNELVVNVRNCIRHQRMKRELANDKMRLEAEVRQKTNAIRKEAEKSNLARQKAEHISHTLEVQAAQLRRANKALTSEINERQEAEKERDKLNSRLIEVSRQVGMAEMATGVLHNVGNALNSVNVSITCMSEKLRHSKVHRLIQVSQMIQENADDLGHFLSSDDRGKHLPAFMSELATLMQRETDFLRSEIEGVGRHVEHIKEIVAAQQSFGSRLCIRRNVEPTDMVEQALSISSSKITRHEINVIREYCDNLPAISIDQHKVVQVLVNLISNAIDAVKHIPTKKVTIRVSREEDNRIQFCVSDTGLGIAADDMPQLFQHGFTTKDDGHGFGLHNSAIVAQSLGGSLSAASDGPGHGASFRLLIPIICPQVNNVEHTECLN